MKKLLLFLVFISIFISACGQKPTQSDYPTGPMVTAPADTKVQTTTTVGGDGLITMNISWEPID